MEHYKTIEKIVEDDIIDYITCDCCKNIIDGDGRIYIEISYYTMGDNIRHELDFCCEKCLKEYLSKHSYMSKAYINIKLDRFKNMLE